MLALLRNAVRAVLGVGQDSLLMRSSLGISLVGAAGFRSALAAPKHQTAAHVL